MKEAKSRHSATQAIRAQSSGAMAHRWCLVVVPGHFSSSAFTTPASPMLGHQTKDNHNSFQPAAKEQDSTLAALLPPHPPPFLLQVCSMSCHMFSLGWQLRHGKTGSYDKFHYTPMGILQQPKSKSNQLWMSIGMPFIRYDLVGLLVSAAAASRRSMARPSSWSTY